MRMLLRKATESLCVASLCASLAIACSSGPSKSQITAAIDEKIKEKTCFALQKKDPPNWPMRVNRGYQLVSKLNPILTAMKSAGYLQITQEPSQNYPGSLVDVITPTEAAKGWWDLQEGYCVGTKAVAEVKEWTEPGKESGSPIQVQFSWHLIDVPSWANRAEFNNIEGMSTPVEGAANLQKTNNGWKAFTTMMNLNTPLKT